MQNKGKDDPVYFIAAVHPQHIQYSHPAGSSGAEQEVKSNTERRRVNINGASAPNLNMFKRLWKFFKKKTLYNQYFENFSEFKVECTEFFRYPHKHHRELRSLLTPNFAIID